MVGAIRAHSAPVGRRCGNRQNVGAGWQARQDHRLADLRLGDCLEMPAVDGHVDHPPSHAGQLAHLDRQSVRTDARVLRRQDERSRRRDRLSPTASRDESGGVAAITDPCERACKRTIRRAATERGPEPPAALNRSGARSPGARCSEGHQQGRPDRDHQRGSGALHQRACPGHHALAARRCAHDNLSVPLCPPPFEANGEPDQPRSQRTNQLNVRQAGARRAEAQRRSSLRPSRAPAGSRNRRALRRTPSELTVETLKVT